MVIGHLEIDSWRGRSIGAVHWYCKIAVQEKDKDTIRLELQRPITLSEAKQLNSEYKSQGYLARHVTAGDLTEGFNSEEDARATGIRYFKENHKGVLFEGSAACYSAWKNVIYWEPEFTPIVNEMTALANEFQALDGYEGKDRKKVESLDRKWQKRYDILRKLCGN